MAKASPFLEGLSERIVPAVSVKFLSGSLTICANPANLANNLVVTQRALDGKFVITDGGVSVGPYQVRGNITIISSNASDSITVNLNRGAGGAFQLPGYLNINARNGSDTIAISADATNGGRIGGNVILSTGYADDTVSITGNGALMSIGGMISANLDSGADTFNLGVGTTAGGSVVTGKGVTLTRANTVNIASAGDPVTINGNLSMDNTRDYGLENTVTLGDTAVLTQFTTAGIMVYNGGTQVDDLSVFGTIQGLSNKNSVINMGQGANTLDINADIGPALNSDLIVTGGAGVDSITLGDDTVISNDAVFSLGAGNNLYSLDSTFAVNGAMSVTAGNGDDDLGVFSGAIGGDLTLTLGNGANSFTFAGAATGGAQSASCHDFNYFGGDGVDTITYDADDGAVENELNVYLETGADVFDGTNSGDASYLTGYIDLGIDTDPDTVIFRSALSSVTEIVNIYPNDTVTAV